MSYCHWCDGGMLDDTEPQLCYSCQDWYENGET